MCLNKRLLRVKAGEEKGRGPEQALQIESSIYVHEQTAGHGRAS